MTQMPNQLLASKTFVSSHARSCPFQKLNDVDNLSIQLHTQNI